MRAAFLTILLVGCQAPIEFTDDLDFTFDFEPFFLDFDGDDLHTPYVRGAPVTIYARPRAFVDEDRLSAAIADPDVFDVLSVTVHDDGHLVIGGVATGVGETELVVTRRGDVLASVPIAVGFPDRVALLPAGPLFVDLDEPEGAPKVLAGGMATFQVAYYDGDERLWGNATLTAAEAQGFDLAAAEQTWLFENREWLQVRASAAGSASVALHVDGEPVETVAFEVVDAAAVNDVAIFGSDERYARDGDLQVLVGQSYDLSGERIFGVEYDWEVDGAVQSGQGDLYRYEYARGAGSTVRASFDGLDATVTANVGEGWVDSSNNLGCDTGGATGSLAWLVGLAALRRRPTASSARGPRADRRPACRART